MKFFGGLKKIVGSVFGSASSDVVLHVEDILPLVGGMRVDRPLDFVDNGFKNVSDMLRKIAKNFEKTDYKAPIMELSDIMLHANPDNLSSVHGVSVPIDLLNELLDARKVLIKSIADNFLKASSGNVHREYSLFMETAFYRGLMKIADTHNSVLHAARGDDDAPVLKITATVPNTDAPAVGEEQRARFQQFRRAVADQKRADLANSPHHAR